jgi:hypothetical protein
MQLVRHCELITRRIVCRAARASKQLSAPCADFSQVALLALLASVGLTNRFAKRRSKVVTSTFFLYRSPHVFTC